MTVQPVPFPGPAPSAPGTPAIAFDRRELSAILSLYGRMVAAGEWRDYAITHRPDGATFAVFRRTAERPLHRIEKRPALRSRQGQYAVLGELGQVLRRGHDLPQVLRALEPRPRAVD